jgi:glycosyltransferase involved in cell wall biosynthesis
MKILLIGNYIHDLQMSMQLFAKSLEDGLKQRGHQVTLIRPEPFFGRLKPSYKGIGKWLGYIDKFFIFPPRLRKAISWADIVHICDHSNAFYAKHLKGAPHLVTCHDLLAIHSALGEIKDNPTKWTGRQFQKMIFNGLKRARYIVCVSESTKNDILRIAKLNPENISVIYYGFNYPYSPMEKTEAKSRLKPLGINSGNPFILHAGKNLWYKNRLGLLHIFRYIAQFKETSEFNLVLAGDGLSKEMHKFIKRHNIERRVFEVIWPEKENLRALYSTAEALLFPSLREGFGWPIIEAQACGCPVFTTNHPPMTEVGSDAAVYIDPVKPQEAARTIVKSLSSSEKMAKMREAGFLNVKRFSTKDMVNKYIQIYEGLYK